MSATKRQIREALSFCNCMVMQEYSLCQNINSNISSSKQSKQESLFTFNRPPSDGKCIKETIILEEHFKINSHSSKESEETAKFNSGKEKTKDCSRKNRPIRTMGNPEKYAGDNLPLELPLNTNEKSREKSHSKSAVVAEKRRELGRRKGKEDDGQFIRIKQENLYTEYES